MVVAAVVDAGEAVGEGEAEGKNKTFLLLTLESVEIAKHGLQNVGGADVSARRGVIEQLVCWG